MFITRCIYFQMKYACALLVHRTSYIIKRIRFVEKGDIVLKSRKSRVWTASTVVCCTKRPRKNRPPLSSTLLLASHMKHVTVNPMENEIITRLSCCTFTGRVFVRKVRKNLNNTFAENKY